MTDDLAAIKKLRADLALVRADFDRGMTELVALNARLRSGMFVGEPVGMKRAPAGSAKIAGYASVFHVRDRMNEIVMPGAFTKSLAAQRRQGIWPLMLWQHSHDEVIGVWEDLTEDSHGLLAEGRLLTDVRRGAEAAVLINAGAIYGLSIGYRVVRDEKDRSTGVRRLLELDLAEVSIVSLPANPEARLTRGKEYTLLDLRRGVDELSGVVRTLLRVR